MISVLVTFHNNSPAATKLLRTLSRTFGMLGTDDVEFLLIDDDSDGEHQIPQLMAGFRAGLPASVTVRQFHFKERQHVSRAMAYGL